ncbi:hypothetical protein WN48_10711 [Eufriesea mexicana]|uniref:Uncharacterized protein n=1 Tax=Eufriesea mexicana TaxID=516756 RepID=A0A310SQB3_9HYME|nr:hypothetical protein WN48_10711 [Eufriesea mexicana]
MTERKGVSVVEGKLVGNASNLTCFRKHRDGGKEDEAGAARNSAGTTLSLK